jgi:hypothetical protein
MSTYETPRQPGSTSSLQRERTLSIIAGVLGILMFAWGFLRWLYVGDGATQRRFSGYAFEMPTTAVIGLSLAAGLIALLGATDRRPGRGVPGAVPTGLAATSLLLASAIFLGKGAISPTLGSEVGVEVGLILALSTAALQTLVLGLNLVSRHDHVDAHDPGASRGGSGYPIKP